MKKNNLSHPPYDKLKGFLKEKGVTYRDIASLLGITPTSVTAKINGKSDFYVSEAQAIKNKYQPEREIFE